MRVLDYSPYLLPQKRNLDPFAASAVTAPAERQPFRCMTPLAAGVDGVFEGADCAFVIRNNHRKNIIAMRARAAFSSHSRAAFSSLCCCRLCCSGP